MNTISTSPSYDPSVSSRRNDFRAASAFFMLLMLFAHSGLFAQGVGISESAITPDASAILELRSATRGFLMPRNAATLGFTVTGLSFYNTTSNRLNYYGAAGWLEIPVKSDNLSVFGSTTSAQLRGILSDPIGTGSAVFADTPTLITPVLGAATGTSLALGGGTALTTTNQTGSGSLVLENTPTLITPVLGAATGTSLALGGGTALTTTNQTGTGNLVLASNPTLTGFSSSGATVNINASSSFATNINTGTSAAAVNIGNTSNGTGVNISTGPATDALTTLGTTGSQVFASSTANSDRIAVQPQTSTATATFEGTITSDDLTAARTWTMPNADGRVSLERNNFSTAVQSIPAATTALLTGSTIAIPSSNLRIGTIFKFKGVVTKTNAGTTATTIFMFKLGTTGTTADATILTFRLGAQTAVVDTGIVEIAVTIRGPISAACVAAGSFNMSHNLSATGLATIPNVNKVAVSGTFNATTAGLIASIACTTGTATVFSFQQVIMEVLNL